MELAKETTQLLEQIPQAVFLVKNNTIIYANQGAQARGVQEGISVNSLFTTGCDEYGLFRSGKLMLITTIAGISYNTIVSTSGEYHLFCLESEYCNPELRAFALASQTLREPLASTMLEIENLLSEDTLKSTPTLLAEVKAINKHLHQMYRTVRNMSDAAIITSDGNKELHNMVALASEWVEKAGTLLKKTGHRIVLNVPKYPIYCHVNKEKLERGFLNLISNAVKFAEIPDDIHVTVQTGSCKLYLSVEGSCNDPQAVINNDLFSRFTREPSLSNSKNGIGLGLPIVHGIAAAHKGALLVDQPNDHRIRFTLSIATQTSGMIKVNFPVMRVDNTGGHDQFRIELSDVLPADLYE